MRILKALSMFATAAITAGGLAAGAANPVSASTAGGCTSYYVIGVRGSTQDYTNFENMGPTVGVYAQNASNLLPSGTTTFQNIIYPATLTNYWGSLGNGIVALADQAPRRQRLSGRTDRADRVFTGCTSGPHRAQ